jgi:hypothetical protein
MCFVRVDNQVVECPQEIVLCDECGDEDVAGSETVICGGDVPFESLCSAVAHEFEKAECCLESEGGLDCRLVGAT